MIHGKIFIVKLSRSNVDICGINGRNIFFTGSFDVCRFCVAVLMFVEFF